jgi:hypothetical protein
VSQRLPHFLDETLAVDERPVAAVIHDPLDSVLGILADDEMTFGDVDNVLKVAVDHEAVILAATHGKSQILH